MIIQFSVSNFRSVGKLVTLSMEAAKDSKRAKLKPVDINNVFEIQKNKLLKSAVIYGANASGKSNLIKAIKYMRDLVLNSSKMQDGDEIESEAFRLSEEFDNQPSLFEIIFLDQNSQLYRYGFSILESKIAEEWLYKKSSREICLFERKNQEIKIYPQFTEGKGLEIHTRANALFLSTVAQLNGEISKSIISWFREIYFLTGLQDIRSNPALSRTIKDVQSREKVIDFIKKLDVDIEDIFVSQALTQVDASNLPQEILDMFSQKGLENFNRNPQDTVFTVHKKYSIDGIETSKENFDAGTCESSGTKKLLHYAPVFIDAIENNKIIIIDELDAKLHPSITRALLQMFNLNFGSNHSAQIVFTTHDTNLLSSDLFRRDQIWFTEKNKIGATDLYSLYDYKVDKTTKIRTDEVYERNYLIGKYGAIPYIKNI
jgi:uncharacterized protein